MAQKKHQTNEQFMAQLMRFAPKSGPLMQAFVLTAIEKYAQQCIEAGAATFDSPLLNGRAWITCANEALERVNAHLKP